MLCDDSDCDDDDDNVADVADTAPGKVLNVRVTHIGSDTLSVAWEPRNDVTMYELRHWKHGDVTNFAVNATSSSNVTLQRLAHDTQYWFQVDKRSQSFNSTYRH